MMYERIVVPIVLYRADTWALKERENKRSRVMAEWAEKCVLRWFGHVERMDDERMAKRVYDSGVLGRRGRGRPMRVLMDGLMETVTNRGMTLEQARETAC